MISDTIWVGRCDCGNATQAAVVSLREPEGQSFIRGPFICISIGHQQQRQRRLSPDEDSLARVRLDDESSNPAASNEVRVRYGVGLSRGLGSRPSSAQTAFMRRGRAATAHRAAGLDALRAISYRESQGQQIDTDKPKSCARRLDCCRDCRAPTSPGSQPLGCLQFQACRCMHKRSAPGHSTAFLALSCRRQTWQPLHRCLTMSTALGQHTPVQSNALRLA